MARTTRALRAGILAAILAFSGLVATAATAADKELLDMLLANGALTQAQYDELLGKEELRKEDLRDVSVSVDAKGLHVETADERFAFRLGGRLQVDASGQRGSIANEATNGAEIRRARFDMEARFFEDYRFKGEVDFAENTATVKDFWVGYTGFDWGRFYVGNQKQPFSLAVEMSSNDIPFIERGTDTDLIIPFVDRAIGFRADFSGKHWYLASGFYGQSVGDNDDGTDAWGQATRFVYAPIVNEDSVLYFAARGAYRDPADNEARLRSETTHISNLFTVNAGTLTGVQDAFLTGPEAAFALGPFAIEGEYNRVFLRRNGAENLDLSSWHVAAVWSLTGERRASTFKMSSGEFKRLKPAHDFRLAGGGIGAWELAARYAAIDLDDADVNGGRQGIFTLGLNWYLNPVVRLMFDWSKILDTNSFNQDAENLDIFQSRVQFAF